VYLDLPQDLSGLDEPLGRDHQNPNQKFDFKMVLFLLCLLEGGALVHEMWQVGDGWDLVNVETDHFHRAQALLEGLEGP
jgi:hypothetical protein